jgi:HEAT repeat protein
MKFDRPSDKTAALIQELRQPPSRFGWLTGEEDKRSQLVDEVASGGEIAAIPLVVDILFDESPRLAEAARDCIHRLLALVPQRDLPAFEEYFRRCEYYYWGSPLRWLALRPESVSRLPKTLASRTSILGLASFHRSGYVRESAVRELDLIEDGSEVPFLLLRLNDWVAAVRLAAKIAILPRLVPRNLEHFHRSIHLVFRLIEWKRDDHEAVVRAVMAQLVSPQHESALHELLNCEDRFVRRRCFQLAVGIEGPHQQRLVTAGLRATDEVVRFWAARSARKEFQGLQLLDALHLMGQDQFLPVRREALLGWIEREPDCAARHLDEALLDRGDSIRELARFHLTKLGKSDFANVYRKAVSRGDRIETALLGLGETGSSDDLSIIMPYVRNERVAIRAAAVRALGILSGEDAIQELLKSLQDDSRRVSVAAKIGLERHLDDIDAANLLSIASSDYRMHVQMAALQLLDQIPTWTALPCLIQMAAHREPVLAEHSRMLIERKFNRVFTNPKPAERLELQHAMELSRRALPSNFLTALESWLRTRQ